MHTVRSLPRRHDVFGSDISLTTVDEVVDRLLDPEVDGLVVVIANVHSIMTSRRRPELADAVRNADIATADGVPLVWALRASGIDSAVRVTGIDVMRGALAKGTTERIRHYFYGSTEPVLRRLVSSIERDYQGIQVAGAQSPPFQTITDSELAGHAGRIRAASPDIVWVGLGMPKQELWMERVRDHLPGITLVGVGAAFDWVAGTTPMAPEWMRQRGLEWLYRLGMEPRRMWRRYAYNNPAFLALLIGRWIRTTSSRLVGRFRPPS